jgi:hypothetical protein
MIHVKKLHFEESKSANLQISIIDQMSKQMRNVATKEYIFF